MQENKAILSANFPSNRELSHELKLDSVNIQEEKVAEITPLLPFIEEWNLLKIYMGNFSNKKVFA